jgi:type 1 glutamine amidotransferase
VTTENAPAGPDFSASDRPLRILVLTGGHRVDLEALLGMVAGVCAERGWLWAHAVQPEAQSWLRPEHAGAWDAILCHDIPGLALKRGAPPRAVGPTLQTALDLAGLLNIGQGLLFTHHALAGWPAWPGWAEVIGGRFLYAPGAIRGHRWPSSGYRLDEFAVQVSAPDHPICDGVDDFVVQDELYACPVFEGDVVPLLRTDADLSRDRWISTYEQVVSGENLPLSTDHPPASDLLGWATSAGRSPIAYLLPGDNAATFGQPMYRRLIANALAWVASAPAHDWAQLRARPVDVSLPALNGR